MEKAFRGFYDTLPNARLSTPSKLPRLEQLVSQVTPSNCTIEIFTEALDHLQPELLPEPDLLDNLLPTDADNARSAALALALLATVTEACDDDPDLNQIVVDKLTGFIHPLCLWIEVLLGFGLCYPASTLCGVSTRSHACFTYAKLLLDLQFVDSRLEKALFSSRTFFHVLLILWMTDDGEEEHRVDHVFEPQPTWVRSPVVTLLSSFLYDDDGREELFHYAAMSPRQFAHDFVSVLRQRACQVRDTSLTEVDPVDVASFFEDLMYVAEILVESSVFRRELSSMLYLYGFASILNTVSIEMKNHAPKDHHLLLDAVHQLAIIADETRPYHAARNYRELVGGGFWGLVIRLLSSVPEGNRHYNRLGLRCLKMLGKYTAYRSVMSRMLVVLLPEESIEGIYDHHGESFSTWMYGLDYRKDACDDAEKRLILCDNPACLSSSPSRLSPSRPKQCSLCCSMVYCSEKCQKEDWNKLHRLECSELREERSLRKESKMAYHHSTRAFHVAIVENNYNSVIGEAEASNAESPNRPMHKLILTLNGVSPSGRCGFEDLDNWEVFHERSTPDYLKPRLWPLIRSYRSGGETNAVRLAGALFPFGGEVVDLVVMLRKKDERWEAVYSVARYQDEEDAYLSDDIETDDTDEDEDNDEYSTDENDDGGDSADDTD
ncbi:hypothetical protein H1R20_g14338, partial [Candolleomyces eurysporus]